MGYQLSSPAAMDGGFDTLADEMIMEDEESDHEQEQEFEDDTEDVVDLTGDGDAKEEGEETTTEAKVTEVFIRFNLGMLEFHDVDQRVKPDVGVYFYYYPNFKVTVKNPSGCRFENIPRPRYKPNFDFDHEVTSKMTTEESYWLDTKTGIIFGHINYIPL